jgi:flagellar basal-body rod modification protein FlgD
MTEITSVPSINTGWSRNATAPAAQDQNLDKDAFLKLLVAQMKYQDPSSPTDMTQFMSQTAQFSLVEKFQEVSQLTTSLLGNSRSQTAVALVGQSVTYLDENQKSHTGVVAGVSMEGGEPILTIDDQKVRLDSVTQVGQAPKDPSSAVPTSS